MASWIERKAAAALAVAESALETADRTAGKKIEQVKEAVGAVGPASEVPREQPAAVPLSEEALALIEDPEARAAARGQASVAMADGCDTSTERPAEPVVLSDAEVLSESAAERKARVSEWESLGQEIQIVTAHGHKLQQRLLAAAAALQASRQSEATLRGQLEEALQRHTAADAERGSTRAAVSAVEQRAAEAEAEGARARAQQAALEGELAEARRVTAM